MNRLEQYRHQKRNENLLALGRRWSLFMAVAGGAILLVRSLSWPQIFGQLETNVALANLILAFALVMITAFYAAMTSATLNEMRAGRIAGIRPILKIRLGHFVAHQAIESSSKLRRLEGMCRVTNVGRGTAVDIRLELHVPWKRNPTEELVRTSIGDAILSLEPGREIELAAGVHVHSYDVKMPDEAFFHVSASFEDIGGNLYEITQFYDLHPIRGISESQDDWRSYLCFEDLRQIVTRSYRRRRQGWVIPSDREITLLER